MTVCMIVSVLSWLLLVAGKKRFLPLLKKMLAILAAAGILGALYGLKSRDVGHADDLLPRKDIGEGEYETEILLDVPGLLSEYPYTLAVPEQRLTAREEKEALEQAKMEIDAEFTEGPKALEELKSENFIHESYVNGKVTAEWSFSWEDMQTPDASDLAEHMGGTLVEATVTLTCGESQCLHTFYFETVPEVVGERERLFREIDEYLSEEGEKAGRDMFKLPESIGGYSLYWHHAGAHDEMRVLLLGVILTCLLPILEKNKRREEKKKRNERLLLEYPDMVGRLALLLGSGMTLKRAWKKLVITYLTKRGQKKQEENPLYEEMSITLREMENGVGEERAYLGFGERCGLWQYRKLANLLTQNLRKGNSNLIQMLQQEADDAFAERKKHARQYGEEAGTRLLFPMMLMLGTVMVILIVPAWLSF